MSENKDINVSNDIETIKKKETFEFKAPTIKPIKAQKEPKPFKSKNTVTENKLPPPKLPSEVYKEFKPSQSEVSAKTAENIPDTENKKESLSFKLPVSKVDKTKTALSEETATKPSEKEVKKQKSVNVVQKSANFNYNLPYWARTTKSKGETEEKTYSFEVLKGGSIIDNLDLGGKCKVVFGRMRDCDFMLEHPHISRYHAVLQFGCPQPTDDVEFQKDGSKGWYLWDNSSTHGSFINKQRCKPRTFYRLKVGHLVKFGSSTRMYILQGPDEDQEEEAKETVTELRERAKARKEKQASLDKLMMGDDSSSDEESEDKQKVQQESDGGVTWGMLEDAVAEEESSDEDDKPHGGDAELLKHLDKDRFYYKDPNKALKHFFETEGLELDFECTERRPGQWTAKLVLPCTSDRGKQLHAEHTCTGRKIEAVNNCALQACQILDQHGMFDQNKGAASKKKSRKAWKEDDYYDSDEDNYLDRTGQLQEKRMARKARMSRKKDSTGETHTYQSLVEKLKQMNAEIADIEKKLAKDKQVMQVKGGSEDSLQAFMRNIKEGKALDSNTRSKLRLKHQQLVKDVVTHTKLAELARPTHVLPAKIDNKKVQPMSLMARMRAKNSTKKTEKPAVNFKVKKSDEIFVPETEDDDVENKADSDLEVERAEIKNEEVENNPAEVQEKEDVIKESGKEESDLKESETTKSTNKSTANEEIEPDKAVVSAESLQEKEDEITRRNLMCPVKPESFKREEEEAPAKKKRKRRHKAAEEKKRIENFEESETYAAWMPPSGQTGDGFTDLNKKLGY